MGSILIVYTYQKMHFINKIERFLIYRFVVELPVLQRQQWKFSWLLDSKKVENHFLSLNKNDLYFKWTTSKSHVCFFIKAKITCLTDLFDAVNYVFIYLPVHPGENLVVQNSTQSTLTTIYNFQQAFEEDSEVEMQEAKYEKPSCGCGWPHHLLLPRGTTQGMHFDLFVIITDSIWLKSEPKDVCVAATILCGLRGGKYPDPFPMGYPFDRLPFIDPDTNEPVFSIEKYSQFIPNSKVTRVNSNCK